MPGEQIFPRYSGLLEAPDHKMAVGMGFYVTIPLPKSVKRLWKGYAARGNERRRPQKRKEVWAMPISANRVADYFLSLADDEEAISNLKLQKLLYYAQGFFMALNNGTPLFREPLKAWAHGPVVTAVYHRFKEFGSGGITLEGLDFDGVTDEVRELLGEVWTTYGQYSAWRLREMTHAEPPWQNTPQGNEISAAALFDFFKTRIITN
jgi:uncharacterized phage-associated protein